MKLGLGTVEFAAKTGKHVTSVSLDEAARILDIAQRSGITLLDTAAQAGNSEEVLGQCLLRNHPFKIVAKTPHFSGEMIIAPHADHLEIAFNQSLENLKQERIYALMTGFHDGLFLTQGEKLYKRMDSLKDQGLIEKIGVSISNAAQLEHLLANYKPDIVQLPLNVLDERLLKQGYLQRLKQKEIEIHARDIFLQGVLLDPTHLHPWFWPIRKQMDAYHQHLIEEGLTPLEGALNFVLGLPEVDYALVGISSAEQLREVIGAVLPDVEPAGFTQFACEDEKFTNPLKWNLYE